MANDDLDPIAITETLGIFPDKTHRKGDANTSISKKGKVIHYSPYRTGVWIINSQEEEHTILEQHLKTLLSTLYPLKDQLIELSNRGYRMDMFCGAFISEVHQPGFDISSDTLLKLGELNIDLGVCIYPGS